MKLGPQQQLTEVKNASRRKLEPKPRLERDKNSRLPKFQRNSDPSGHNAYAALMNYYSKVRGPSPGTVLDTYALYENTISQVHGGIYMDHEGNYYQVP